MNITLAPEGKASTGKLYAGEVALDGSNPTPVTLPFSNVDSVALTLKGGTAPGDNTSILTYAVVGNVLNIYAWKNTGGTDPTLVASTGTETVSFQVVGH